MATEKPLGLIPIYLFGGKYDPILRDFLNVQLNEYLRNTVQLKSCAVKLRKVQKN